MPGRDRPGISISFKTCQQMNVAYTYLQHCGIVFNRDTARQFLASHPYHPSLLSLSDLFDEFGTENTAIQLDPGDLEKVPLPFLATVHTTADEDFVMVRACSRQQVTYLNNRNRSVTVSADQFAKIFGGTVFLAEKNETSGEPHFEANRKAIRNRKAVQIAATGLVAAAAISGFATQNLNNQFSIPLMLLLLAKAAGLAITILLLIQRFGSGHDLIQKLCQSKTGNGCNQILSSPGAYLFKGALSWSEAGFLYFSITLLYLCMQRIDPGTVKPLLYLNILALPYSIYSVWYQYRAKSWCRLCLSVQVVLWLEFAAALPLMHDLRPAFSDFIYLLMPAMLIPGLWFISRPFLERSALVNELSKIANTFRKDEQLFLTLLHQQHTVSVPPQLPVVLGNPDAPFEIMVVSNPLCTPCAKTHQQLNTLMENCGDRLRVSLIFMSSGDSNDDRYKLHKRFIAIYQASGSLAAKAAIDSWYRKEGQHTGDWLGGHACITEDSPSVHEQLAQQLEWCFEQNISHTPAIFINGHLSLPQYTLPDLEVFIMKQQPAAGTMPAPAVTA